MCIRDRTCTSPTPGWASAAASENPTPRPPISIRPGGGMRTAAAVTCSRSDPPPRVSMRKTPFATISKCPPHCRSTSSPQQPTTRSTTVMSCAISAGDDHDAESTEGCILEPGSAPGDEQALGTHADGTVEVAQHAGGEARTTGRDGRLRLQADPLADRLTVQVH